MRIIGLIPARMESSRFPGKPLVDIEGMPMVIHVLKRSQLCKSLLEVYVATDSKEIFKVVKSYGGKAIMTSAKHKTGTDRIAQAAKNIDCDMVVNIQGDEPLVNPLDIDKLTSVCCRDKSILTATLVCRTYKRADKTECKVVLDIHDDIMYMSRADIPSNVRVNTEFLYKLYCVIAFRKEFLKKFSAWRQTPLERIEFIEYLRILEKGYKMRGVKIKEYTTSVDTPEDLVTIKKMMKKDMLKFKYLL